MTAVVTGGTKGLGLAMSQALAAAGHQVAAIYRSDSSAASSCGFLAVQGDMGSSKEVDAAITSIEESLGPVSVLVNNAGSRRSARLTDMTDDDWSACLRDSLDGSFYAIRRVASGMAERGFGRIVNVGSAGALTGVPRQANYAAAKTGLIGLTRVTAREFAPHVTCNVVFPGIIDGGMTDAITGAVIAVDGGLSMGL